MSSRNRTWSRGQELPSNTNSSNNATWSRGKQRSSQRSMQSHKRGQSYKKKKKIKYNNNLIEENKKNYQN